jgi:hypothetical protein
MTTQQHVIHLAAMAVLGTCGRSRADAGREERRLLSDHDPDRSFGERTTFATGDLGTVGKGQHFGVRL